VVDLALILCAFGKHRWQRVSIGKFMKNGWSCTRCGNDKRGDMLTKANDLRVRAIQLENDAALEYQPDRKRAPRKAILLP
jgi:hypothetical protein